MELPDDLTNISVNNCSKSFTNEQKTHLLVAIVSSGIVSSVMCFIAISMVLYWKLYKYFVYRLALYQVLAALIYSMTETLVLMNINYTKDAFHVNACMIAAFIFVYIMWIKLLFTLCLVFHIFCLAVCLKNLQKFEFIYIIVCVLFPSVYCWIPFIHSSYGLTNTWCWIRDWKDDCSMEKNKEGIIEQFTLWYGPLMLSLPISFLAVIMIMSVLAKRAYSNDTTTPETEPLTNNQRSNKTVLKQLLPLLAYPVIFFALALFPLVDRIYEAISPYSSYPVVLVHSISNAMWGFFCGVTLLIHVLLLHKKKGTHKQKAIETNLKEAETAVYTTYTDASTGAVTYASMPGESDIELDY